MVGKGRGWGQSSGVSVVAPCVHTTNHGFSQVTLAHELAYALKKTVCTFHHVSNMHLYQQCTAKRTEKIYSKQTTTATKTKNK